MKLLAAAQIGIGGGSPWPWGYVQSGSLETFVTRWYTRDFPPVRPLPPLAVPADLKDDPSGAYLQALLDDRLPRDIPSLCRQIQAALQTKQHSLAFSSLLWRNLSENLLNGNGPESRTEEERQAVRETLSALKAKTDAWRKEIFGAKLKVHLAAQGRFGDGGNYGGGAFGSKAGPRPRPYEQGLAWDAADERWGQVGLKNEAVETFLQQHPFAQDHELQLALPQAADWKGGRSRERTIGVLDTLSIVAAKREFVPVEVKWDARPLHSSAHACLCWNGTLDLPANVELTYVDVLRHARGSVRDWDAGSSALRNGPFQGYRRAGYFNAYPLNPLLLADVQARHRPVVAGVRERKDSVEAQYVAALIAQLGDDDFDTRTVAQKKLMALGNTIVDLLARYQDDEDPEIRARVRAIMAATKPHDNGASPIPVAEQERLLLLWLTDFWML